MADDATNDDQNLVPSNDQKQLNNQDIPANTLGEQQEVPEDIANAGHRTDVPEDDSPETLDEAIAQGDERGAIDPTDTSGPQGLI